MHFGKNHCYNKYTGNGLHHAVPDIAMSLSQHLLLKGCHSFKFQPTSCVAGTVVASESSLLLVLDLPGFRTRSASPMPGEGLQVHAGYIGALTSNGIVTLVDGSGVQIFSSPIRIAVPNLAG